MFHILAIEEMPGGEGFIAHAFRSPLPKLALWTAWRTVSILYPCIQMIVHGLRSMPPSPNARVQQELRWLLWVIFWLILNQK